MNIKFQYINRFIFKNLIALFVIVLATAACGGGSTETTSAISVDPREKFALEKGNFSVSFPTTPSERIQMRPHSAIGDEVYTYQVQDDHVTFAVTYNSFDQTEVEPSTQLDRVRDELLNSLAASLVAEEPITMAGYLGRHLEFSFNDPDMVGGGVGVARLFVVDDRLYQVSVVGSGAALTHGKVERFLTSFDLLELSSVEAMAH